VTGRMQSYDAGPTALPPVEETIGANFNLV
jgi:hypothetical protein